VGHCRNRSFDCRFPASSLKECVYALSGPDARHFVSSTGVGEQMS
jgi:hypothetical protein